MFSKNLLISILLQTLKLIMTLKLYLMKVVLHFSVRSFTRSRLEIIALLKIAERTTISTLGQVNI